MINQRNDGFGSVPSYRVPQRIAVIGAGLAGLTCARELRLRGDHPVVFEAGDRMGGRCSSRQTRVGWFDDGAQVISTAASLLPYAAQRPGELAAIHPWTVPATTAEEARLVAARDRDKLEDEADATRTLKLMGVVGVPSMLALANCIARPLDVRLKTPVHEALRRGDRWVLRTAGGEIDEDFQALVLAIPAPLALPLARESRGLSAALQAVRYSSRWVLLLGSERPVGLPGYREFEGSPIERVAAMHSKPGRPSGGPQRWFIEADALWSLQHAHDDTETVADLLLDNFRAHADRPVTPNFLCAHQWQHAFVETPASLPGQSNYLWDEAIRLGVCGDSVVASQVERVHRSGSALAIRMTGGWLSNWAHSGFPVRDRVAGHTFAPQAVHG